MHTSDDGPRSTGAGLWRGRMVEGGAVAVGIALWWWLLAPPVSRPGDLGLLLSAVPPIAAAVVVAERWRGGGAAALAASALVIFLVLRISTGGSLFTLVCFALGLLRPAAWEGEHPLLRAVPLALLVAHPLRPSRGTAIVSALGVTAFAGIALAIWRSAG